ncbi:MULTISPECIES: ABC transporter permease [Mesobacillus]|uniref:Spermidine/putrescine transport system permease protein n=1 Tax=Mesobacillus stamsii TaxID=225347 RepID=A0ABU0FYZ1_9BACI|nr:MULTISPECIES: ABC transporter permease subunit [Mesobacillus]MDQ0414776.1 putative spermidine/putrescine transport system permease protein [Mesobacillus stamsii]
MKRKQSRKTILLLVPFFLMTVMFLVIPLAIMVKSSFTSETTGGFTFANYFEVLTNSFYSQSFLNSGLISGFSAIAGLILAIIVSYAMTNLPDKLQDKLTVYINLAANFAGVPLAFAFIILLGNSGVFTLFLERANLPLFGEFKLYSWQGLAITYLYFQIPLGILFIYPSLKKIKKEWKEAAYMLGASSVTYWRKVGLPNIMPSIAGTFIIMFANGMGTYETAYALTGSNINLVTIRIAALVSGDIYARPVIGSTLAVLFAAIMMAILALSQMLLKKVRRDLA